MILFGFDDTFATGSTICSSPLPEHAKNMQTTTNNETANDMIILRFIQSIKFFVAKIVKKGEKEKHIALYTLALNVFSNHVLVR